MTHVHFCVSISRQVFIFLGIKSSFFIILEFSVPHFLFFYFFGTRSITPLSMWSSPPEALSLLWSSLFAPCSLCRAAPGIPLNCLLTRLPVCKYRRTVFLRFLRHFGRAHLLVAFRRVIQRSKCFLGMCMSSDMSLFYPHT